MTSIYFYLVVVATSDDLRSFRKSIERHVDDLLAVCLSIKTIMVEVYIMYIIGRIEYSINAPFAFVILHSGIIYTF